MVRILLADDHDVVRKGLRVLLEQREGWVVCSEARNGREAVEQTLTLRPNVAIIDLAMPELNGLEATRRIRRALPSTEVLIFTMHENEAMVRDVLSAGARGYLLKSDAARFIVAAVEALSQHKPFFTWKVSQTILDGYLKTSEGARERRSKDILTSREREIVQLLAEGRNNKNISALLEISVKTVETHRATIMRKLELNSVAQLVRYAVRNKLIEP